jgi:hypothetical protein
MHRLRCLVVIGALAVAVSAVAVGPAVAAKGGNSDNAHACQQGGHETLVAAEDPTISFKNAGDCASHGAKGGASSSLQIVPNRYDCFDNTPCWGTIEGTGLDAGSLACANNGDPNNGICWSADGSGNLDRLMTLPCGDPQFLGNWVATGQVHGTTITSNVVASPC